MYNHAKIMPGSKAAAPFQCFRLLPLSTGIRLSGKGHHFTERCPFPVCAVFTLNRQPSGNHDRVPVYTIVTPALAYPSTVLTRLTPAAVIEYTISKRVSVVTGMLSPVSKPFEVVPMASAPVKAGASVTAVPAIGVNVLSGVVDSYSCAVMVTVVPTNAKATVVLKKAAIEVMVPSRGTENASLTAIPGPPVKSIDAPRTVNP